MVSAYFTKLGHFLMRGVDVLMAFPALLMALVLNHIAGAKCIQHDPRDWHCLRHNHRPHPLRHDIKVEGRSVRRRRLSALALGTFSILFRHILPNLVSPLLVQASFIFAFAQLQAAALDFLGLGLPPEVPSWGNMLSEERIYVTRAPWLLIYPGILIVLSVFSMNLVGDALRDSIDPRFKDDISGV